MTQWDNDHTTMARVLYSVILETLNLARTKTNFQDRAWVDVEIEIDGRHATCSHARKYLMCLKLISLNRCLIGIQTDGRLEIRKRRTKPVDI